jgi:hypothetical protein
MAIVEVWTFDDANRFRTFLITRDMSFIQVRVLDLAPYR